MDEQLQQLLAILGVANAADGIAAINRFTGFLNSAKTASGKSDVSETLNAALASLSFAKAVETATGKMGDEAVGLIRAAMASHAALPQAQARVAELEARNEANELETLITKAKNEKRCTPHIEASVRTAFTAKEITLAGAKAWLENSPVIPALEQRDPAPPTQAGGKEVPPPHLEWNGKTYSQLKGAEKAALKRENPELFEAMRASSN